ncbi:MAG: glycosyltransferase [Candidatus Aenigmarchaeota archaeon]|nr:glycosyltransferase [Candidatus Aenigmarchaeota archaeon]
MVINTLKPKTTVIVPAKNEERFIESCLKALKNQTKPCEIIVVDGHSTDRTRKIAEKYADRIVLDNRKGIANARNIGARFAKRNIIAYCDADAIPKKHWIENIEKEIKGKIAVYGPIVPYDGGKKTKAALVFLNSLIQFLHTTRNPCFCAANLAIRKSVLLKHKFNEKYSILEDYELGSRLAKHGKITYSKKLAMPISSRRYEGRLLNTIFTHYLRNAYRIKTGKNIDPGKYWSELRK